MTNNELSKYSLDIILPCYNPISDWTTRVIDSFQRIRHLVPGCVEIHLHIINDGSKLGITSSEIDYLHSHIKTLNFISYEANKGKGYALRRGINQAQSDFIIYTDIDFPYEEKSLLEIYNKLKLGEQDVVIGIRDESYYKDVPKIRIFISKFLKSAMRLLLKLPVEDTQCGLKGFNKKVKPIFLSTRIERYLFDIEFIYLLSKNRNIRIGTHIVNLKSGVRFSKMNFKILFREAFNFLSIFSDHRRDGKLQ